MIFPYALVPARPNGAFPDRKATRRPVLKVDLRKNGKALTTWTIVDSGADFCLFPASVARALDITVPNPNAKIFSGSSDSPQIEYFERISATIWNGDPAHAPIVFDLYAGFCDTLEHAGIGLLGQTGFFSRFSVCFDYANDAMTIA
jgi:hypothetical protein